MNKINGKFSSASSDNLKWVSEIAAQERTKNYISHHSVEKRIREIRQLVIDDNPITENSYTITVNPDAHREFLIKFDDGKVLPILGEGLVDLELLGAGQIEALMSNQRRECIVRETA